MIRSKVKKVVVHKIKSPNIHALSEGISELHVNIIERKLNQSGLSKKEKIEVIDEIIDNLKASNL
ncbi:hypothetical protein [Anaerotignum sp.]|uniref:hypothetical protein n=1 Tax=Anaerotignum sp. TaxID=2039241 RepID=UPI0028B07436|nr:hypothetical protein [Anaerotignum sp.]